MVDPFLVVLNDGMIKKGPLQFCRKRLRTDSNRLYSCWLDWLWFGWGDRWGYDQTWFFDNVNDIFFMTSVFDWKIRIIHKVLVGSIVVSWRSHRWKMIIENDRHWMPSRENEEHCERHRFSVVVVVVVVVFSFKNLGPVMVIGIRRNCRPATTTCRPVGRWATGGRATGAAPNRTPSRARRSGSGSSWDSTSPEAVRPGSDTTTDLENSSTKKSVAGHQVKVGQKSDSTMSSQHIQLKKNP